MGAPYGFLDFGEDDSAVNGGNNSVILSCELTSAANLAAQFGVTAGTPPTFDPVRGMIGNGAGLIKFIAGAGNPTWTVANANKLKYGGHITMWVEREFLDLSINAGTLSPLYLGNNQVFTRSHNTPTNSDGLQLLFGAPAGGSILPSSHVGRDQYARIDIPFTACPGSAVFSAYSEIYVDEVLSWYHSVNPGTFGVFNNYDPTTIWFWGSFAITQCCPASVGALYRIQVSTRPIWIPRARDHLDFVAFGDSIFAQGGLNKDASGDAYNRVPLSRITANTQDIAGGATLDTGIILGIRRQFAQHNLMPTIWDYAKFGASSNNFAAHITSCLTTDKQTGLDYAVVDYGANDAASGAPTTKANYKTNISNGIATLLAAGIKKIFLVTPTTTMHYAGQVLGTNGAATTNYGEACAEIATANPTTVVLVDWFTATGGHDDASCFQSQVGSEVHPNAKGHKVGGDLLNPAIEANVNWSGA